MRISILLLLGAVLLLASLVESRSGKGLKGRNQEGGKNRELIKTPLKQKYKAAKNINKKVVDIKIKQKGPDKQKVSAKMQTGDTMVTGLKGRDQEGGKNKELLKTHLKKKYKAAKNTNKKVVDIKIKQKGQDKPKVLAKMHSEKTYKMKKKPKQKESSSKKKIAIVRPKMGVKKSHQRPKSNDDNKVLSFFKTVPVAVKSFVGQVKKDIKCVKINQDCLKQSDCCAGLWCHTVRVSDPKNKMKKVRKGLCSKCLEFESTCALDVSCCSKKCIDMGGYGQCAPTERDRRRIIAAEKKVNRLLIEEMKKKILSGKKPLHRYYHQ